jgi:hypothetical protein
MIEAFVMTDHPTTAEKEVNTDPPAPQREHVRNPRIGCFFQGEVLEEE